MKTINQKVQQKGFTFVELLIIMIVVAILSGIGIQFVLSVQEDKARLTNAKAFLVKDVPAAIYSCILRRESIITCDASRLITENIDEQTEWRQRWAVGGYEKAPGALESVSICYPLGSAGTQAENVGDGLVIYLNNQFKPAASEAIFYTDPATFTDFVTSAATIDFVHFDGKGGTNTSTTHPVCQEDNIVVVRYVTRE